MLEKRPRLPPHTKLVWLLALVFGVVSVATIVAGILLFRAQAATTQAEATHMLESIAALKVRQIADWRGERAYDARNLSHSAPFRDLFETWYATRDAEQAEDLRTTLRSYLDGGRYVNVVLVDGHGAPLLVAMPERKYGFCHDTPEQIAKAIAAQEVVFGDVMRCGPSSAPQIQVVAPIGGAIDGPNAPTGATVFIIDPEQFLYPLIQRWPVPSSTSETLLVRREGDEVLFLNELRHRPNTALDLRLPISMTTLPASVAAQGEERTLLGSDYRGQEVLAVTRVVPDSTWVMVAKTDTAELFAELTGTAYRFAFSIVALIGLSGAVISLIFSMQQSDSLRQLYTEQRARQVALERFESLFNYLSAGVVVHAADTRILYANPASCRMLGLTTEQINGKMASDSSWHFVQGDGVRVEPEAYPVNAVRTTGTPVRDALFGIVTTAQARPLWVLVDAFPVLEAEQLQEVVVTFVDVTERQQAQEERARLLQELELKNRDLENVVYVASHDLRSPLVNIQGFSQRLRADMQKLSKAIAESTDVVAFRGTAEPLLVERIPTALRFITGSVTKMDALINGLLRLSRAGRSELHPELVDMNVLMAAILTTLAFQLEKAAAQVTIEELPACWGDSDQINQVFSNLLDNAIKYRDPARPLLIHISGRKRQSRALYTVADTGLGIPPDYQERIWEVFHRLDPDSDVAGEGLGLTLTRRIVDRQNGRIWVESQPDVGSQFHVDLPASEYNQPMPKPESRSI